MGGKGSGRRKVIRKVVKDSPTRRAALPSFLRQTKLEKPVKVIILPPAAFREAPPLSKHKRTKLKKDPPPLPENAMVKMVFPEEIDRPVEKQPEPVLVGAPLPSVEKAPKQPRNKVKQLTIVPPPVMSATELKTYREYCLSIIDKAERSGLLRELVLLLNTFRILFQKQIYRATEEITTILNTPSSPQRGRQYSKRSE